MYGVNSNGFQIPSFDAIKANIEGELTNNIGESINFETGSVFNSIVSVLAERELSLWEAMQHVYYSNFVDTASGSSLDYAVAGNALTRLRPTYSRAVCQFTGENFSIIPALSEIKQKDTSRIFVNEHDVTLSNVYCTAITMTLTTETQLAYTVRLSGTAFTYDVLEDDTEVEILEGLVAKINENDIGVLTETDGVNLYLASQDVTKTFSCFNDGGLEIISVTNNVNVRCAEKGAFAIPAHSLAEIYTPATGWESVDNFNKGTTGRNLESDVELRDRHRSSLSIAGSSTAPAIQARLAQLEGVTSAQVISDIENHTVKALVIGGDDEAIANTLYLTKPAGIATVGVEEKIVVDREGNNIAIKFSRPQKIYVYVSIDLTVNNNFEEDTKDTIAESIYNYINSLGISNDVNYQALFASVYSVAGITNAIIKIGGTVEETVEPELKAENIVISDERIATPILDKIEINIV